MKRVKAGSDCYGGIVRKHGSFTPSLPHGRLALIIGAWNEIVHITGATFPVLGWNFEASSQTIIPFSLGLHSSARALACLARNRTPHHTTANISLTDQLYSLWRRLLVSFLTTVAMSIILVTLPSLELFVFAAPMP